MAVIVVTAVAWLTVAPTAVRVIAASDPVIAAAGDIACDSNDPKFNNGLGQGTGVNDVCRQGLVSNLLVSGGYSAVLALGDVQYYCGSLTSFDGAYDPSWGRVKSITHPVVGNHEYLTTGAADCTTDNAGASGYFSYFGSAAGSPGAGYYSFDVGAWHLIALNSNCTDAGGCIPTSPQGQWLAADLAAHQNQCILAYWHIPLFSSGGRAAQNSYWLWKQLYAAHADVVLDGHDHIYERFAPQTPDGVADPVNGITEITVGTGGANHTAIAGLAANSVVDDTTSFGILRMTLHSSSIDWQFLPVDGTFTDSGSAACHNASPAVATPTPSAPPSTPPSTPPSAPPSTPPSTASASIVADSYVDSSAPTVTHGTLNALRFDGSPTINSYLRFNVTGVSGTVTSATLRVFANTAQTTGYDVYSVADNTWGETTIDWANAPPFGTTKLGSSGKITAGTWTSVDVTPAVTGNGTYSFGLSTTNATAVSLSSREGLSPPQLVLTTSTSGPSSPPPSDPPSAPPSTPPSTPPSDPPSAPPSTPPSTPPSDPPSAPPSAPPNTGSASIVADSYVDSAAPTLTHGTINSLRFDGSPIVNSYLRFSVVGLSGTVTSATLRVFANTAQTTGYDVYSVADNTWGETTIDWANAPPFGTTKLGSSGKITAGTWTSVDVTPAVTGNGTYSFGLSTTNATAVSLSSREGLSPPQLVLTTSTSGASIVPPFGPGGPDRSFAILYLLPILAPALLMLERRRIRRVLVGTADQRWALRLAIGRRAT